MATSKNSNNMVVFMGGYDAEMVEIANACREAGVTIVDKHLGWGAAASAYTSEIAQAISEGKQPVLRRPSLLCHL